MPKPARRPPASEDVVTASLGTEAAAWAILVHGGAGDIHADSIPSHVTGCERAAEVASLVLASGGSALDAVQRAVEALEDDPLFNAGTGACLDADGHIALDASIMDGSDLSAGAVCALPPFKNPIAIARRVMEDGPHVLLAAEGAASFAEARGFERVDEETLITESARERWRAARAKGTREVTAGTVGAVARDASGRVAAATSTGGMVNKLPGRVGDSPILGAGTYADDDAGACSTTGHGEAMIRIGLARTATDALRTGSSPEHAIRYALALMHARTGQTGGAILVGADGTLGLARTTRTMTWAAITSIAKLSGA